jgi:hypothetical protein
LVLTVGEIYDYLSGKTAKDAGEDLLRDKYPATLGLSAETAADLEAGRVEIDDDRPQAQMLKGTDE